VTKKSVLARKVKLRRGRQFEPATFSGLAVLPEFLTAAAGPVTLGKLANMTSAAPQLHGDQCFTVTE
jgi:hypothetical protein